jgi:3-phosphoshikimate 1-carboxyvinyltransferase
LTDVTIKKTKRLIGQVCAPPSKSYTQRMLIAAALAKGASKISDPLVSEDTEATLRAVEAIGARIKKSNNCWIIEGARTIENTKNPIDVGESGATLRFMIPITALAAGPSTLVFRGSLERRPVEPLLESLRQLGAKAYSGKLDDADAVFVEGGGIGGGKTTIPGNVSSQFVSGLMFACPLAKKDTEVTLISPLESEDYVKMTEIVLSKHAIVVDIYENRLFISAKQAYKPADDKVPGDFSSTAFLLAAAAITTSRVQVNNLDYGSVQGDKAILGILKQMGVNGKVCPCSVEIEGEGNGLGAVDVDARNIPDLVPAITALACYAKSNSHIFGAHRLRLKESDRLNSLSCELTKMGAQIIINHDGLTVRGGSRLRGALIDPHNDHRIAMACAVAALGAEGETTIQNAECVRKSYPQFFTHLRELGADVVGGKFDR